MVKKGKQSSGFRSKAERGNYLSNALKEAAESRPTWWEEVPSAPTRPKVRSDALSSLRRFLVARESHPVASSSLLSPPLPPEALDRSVSTQMTFRFLGLEESSPESLAEKAAWVVGSTLGAYSSCFSEPLSFIPAPLISRMSYAASSSGELTAQNVHLLFTDNVEALVLHGDFGIDSLRCLVDAPGDSLSSGVAEVPGITRGGILADVDEQPDFSWEERQIAPLQLSMFRPLNLKALSLGSSNIPGSFILALAEALPNLETLAFLDAPNSDGLAHSSFLTAVPKFRHVETLELSGCSWVTDELLLEACPLFPVFLVHRLVLAISPDHQQKSGSCYLGSSSPRLRLQRLICLSTSVTSDGSALLKTMLNSRQQDSPVVVVSVE